MSIFSVGISGLNAAQAGIYTASHNISNASTPGYSRQEIVQGANVATATDNGFLGQGTHVQTVKRIYDVILSAQVLSAETSAAEMESYLAQVEQIDNLLADPSAGLSPALSGFFKAVQDVAANPASIPGRQSMISAAQALVARFQALDDRLSEIRNGVNQQISAQVTQINAYGAQLADLNQRITLAQAGSVDQPPNDLLDQRDQVVRELNKIIRVSTVTQGDGSYSVFIGTGQPLVIGTQAYRLQAVATSGDPQRTTVAFVGAGGTPLTLPESQIAGGSLGGVLSFRSESLDTAQNALGRLALTLAQNFNDQQALGLDLNSDPGQSLFTLAAPTVNPSAFNNAASTGAPDVTIDAATIDQLSDSAYRLDYDGTDYTLTRLSDNTATVIVSPQVVDGLNIDFSTWTATSGDSFLIQPTRTGARAIALAFSDPRMIAAAAPIRTGTSVANTGTGKIDSGSVSSVASFPLAGTVTLTYDSSTSEFNATGAIAAGPFSKVAGQWAISFSGMTVNITGNPADGDTFTISNNANGVTDNRNAALMGALQTRSTMLASAASAATASYQSAYAQMVSAVGSKTNEVQAMSAAHQVLAEKANRTMQSLSGVNLDEEAANLLRYQQAYQASAKVLQIASAIFEEILSLGQ